MALHGNLRDFAATEILQLVAGQKKTGCLRLDSDQGRARFYVNDGRLVSARAPGLPADDPLLALLRRANRLSEDQIHGIRTIHGESGRDLEDLLVNGRYLEAEELSTYLERQLLNQLMHCVQWSAGSYEFDPEDRWVNTPILKLSIEASVIEAARRVDEQKRYGRMFADPHQVLAVRDLPDPGDQVSDDELEMFEIVDGRLTVGQIVEQAPLLEFEAYEALHRMLEAGWIQVIGRDDAQVAAGPRPMKRASIVTPRPATMGSSIMKEVAMALLVGGLAVGGWFVSRGMGSDAIPAGGDPFAQVAAAHVREALDLHQRANGSFPERLDVLAADQWLPADRLRLSGRTLRYDVAPDGQSYDLTID